MMKKPAEQCVMAASGASFILFYNSKQIHLTRQMKPHILFSAAIVIRQ